MMHRVPPMHAYLCIMNVSTRNCIVSMILHKVFRKLIKVDLISVN